jgi:hypothetical protein
LDNDLILYRPREASLEDSAIDIDIDCAELQQEMGAVIRGITSEKFQGLRSHFLEHLKKLRQSIYCTRRDATVALVRAFVAPELKLQNYGEWLNIMTGQRIYKTDLTPLRKIRKNFPEVQAHWLS